MEFIEIRDPLHGTIEISELEKKIIDTQAYQRLRNIKQLGFGSLVFPSANHTRYIHSLGACHLSGTAFNRIFLNQKHFFKDEKDRKRLLQTLRLACLFHDLGHGPLSHCIESSMPDLKSLNIKIYKNRKNRQAHHEDYTIKYLTEDEEILDVFQKYSKEIKPEHIASLIDFSLEEKDQFFIGKNKVDMRPILSQIVSSEIDVDRLDYLKRDAYFCGTNYGSVEADWIVSHFSSYEKDNQLFLSLDSRSILVIENFLVSRMHMHLIVYGHRKTLIYEKMLTNYLASKDCSLKVPSDLKDYTDFTDDFLLEHLKANKDKNEWAYRIVNQKHYKTVFDQLYEKGNKEDEQMFSNIKSRLQKNFKEGKDFIIIDQSTRLSKSGENHLPIFVQNEYKKQERLLKDEASIFRKFSKQRSSYRIYVKPELEKKIKKFIHE